MVQAPNLFGGIGRSDKHSDLNAGGAEFERHLQLASSKKRYYGPNGVIWPGSPANEKYWTKPVTKQIEGLLRNDGRPREADCNEEIREAREICTKAFANGWKSDHDVGPYTKKDRGRWTIQDCMRGLISERCGGNRKE